MLLYCPNTTKLRQGVQCNASSFADFHFTCILCLCTYGAHNDVTTTPKVEAELIALTEAWIDAEVKGDRGALERILDERFLVTYASGKTGGRDEYIDLMIKSEIQPFGVSYDEIRVHGNTAVVVNTITGTPTKITWVAVRQEGQWRAIVQTFSTVKSSED